jgi:hypothetical protein
MLKAKKRAPRDCTATLFLLVLAVHQRKNMQNKDNTEHTPTPAGNAAHTGPTAADHDGRLAAGQACLHAALDIYLPLGLSVTCCCDPGHVGVGKKHARQCNTPGKSPVHTWKGLQERLPTPEEVRRWWHDFPVGNVGCVLGQVSGLVRVDVDGPEGEKLLMEWSAGDLPQTWTFRSSPSGRGLLYRWPREVSCKSTAMTKPGAHRELRLMGNGSQTVLPPSRHASGMLYTWEPGLSPDDLPLTPAPRWLVERLRQEPRRNHQRPEPGTHEAPEFARVASALAAIPNDDADYDAWLFLGMALHSTRATWARGLWDGWSQQSGKYNEAKQDKSWQSFKADGTVTIASLFQRAQGHGWRPPRTSKAADSAEQDAQGRRNGHKSLMSSNQATVGEGEEGQEGHTPAPPWTDTLLRNKSGMAQQTINNFILAIQHLEPWKSTGCWYDTVREVHLVGAERVKEGDDTAAGALIERATGIRVTNLALVGRALDYVCRQNTRDLLQEWVATLPNVSVSALLTTWLRQYANVPDTVSDAYVADVSRIIPVSMIARILCPGCQYRYVPILEGPEDIGKSKLTKVLAGHDQYGRSWHVALSAGMEGKEAHMMLDGALVAELEELSSYTKTDENRMKALITAEVDSFVPKFANKRVDHPRRTVFIATVNPEGDGAYLKGQAGNTRFLPITVGAINIAGFLGMRTQLFAEAKAYYLAHLEDWWKLGCEEDAANEREERRQTSVYEGEALQGWLNLRQPATCTWQDVAELHLHIPKDRWNKLLQMEISKALKAHGWRPDRTNARRYWVRAR